MSETLSAILKDMCGADGDPLTPGATSGSGTGGGGQFTPPVGVPRRL